MKHASVYLGTFTIYDGEHEHTGHALVKARSMAVADRKLSAEAHEVEDDKKGCFNYGDGMTRSRLNSIRGLTEEETKVVINLGLAYFV